MPKPEYKVTLWKLNTENGVPIQTPFYVSEAKYEKIKGILIPKGKKQR